MNRRVRTAAILAACFAVAALNAGCAHAPHLAWPWRAKAPPAPRAVHELVVRSADGIVVRAFPQYWVRNTLIVDLSGAASTGVVVLVRRDAHRWPARMGFRVRPAEIRQLEAQGDQRIIMPISPEAGDPVDLELAPGAYNANTAAITVRW